MTETSSPEWMYLFGSQDKGCTYTVFLRGAQTVSAKYSDLTWTPEEWAAVPDADAIKIDADDAYQKAIAEFARGSSALPYTIDLITYWPADDTQKVDTMAWYIVFDPEATEGSAPRACLVDAINGKVSEVKQSVSNR